MIPDKTRGALNQLYNDERQSSALYMAMAVDFGDSGLRGFEKWLLHQSEEENKHALKVYHHICDRGARPVPTDIKQPKLTWKSPELAIDFVVKSETEGMAKYQDLISLCREHDDFASEHLGFEFVEHYVKEIKFLSDLLTRIQMIGNSQSDLLYIDKEIGRGYCKNKYCKES